jgi:hypothetical protein
MYYDEAPDDDKNVRLGVAVAASACVPGLFAPVVFDALYEGLTLRLVDPASATTRASARCSPRIAPSSSSTPRGARCRPRRTSPAIPSVSIDAGKTDELRRQLDVSRCRALKLMRILLSHEPPYETLARSSRGALLRNASYRVYRAR